MRTVSIIGAGLTKFGEHWSLSLRDMAVEAGINAIESAGIEGKELEAIFTGCMASGRFIGQEHIGALVADHLGLNPIPSTRLEAACASGGVALRNAVHSIVSGEYNMVLVTGVEKMTEVSGGQAGFALGGAGDQETELFHGATFPALYALMAKKHMQEFGTTEEQMAQAAVQNHKNAMHNPFAQFHKEFTLEQVMKSGYVSSPLKLLDCSPLTDGSAAIILAETQTAKKICQNPVEIIASTQASDTIALTGRKSLTEIAATKIAAKGAFKKTGLSAKDIDVAEVHDCFTIAQIMAIEDLGFFKKGEGGRATEKGLTALNSEITVNPSGGLKAVGHPVAATGIKQACEIFWQLRGEARGRQVKNAKIGLTHNVGGSGATCVVHIFKQTEGKR